MSKADPNAPLTPAVLHILLALSRGERHGYAIMKEVEADTSGTVKMGPGTLYGSLNRMMKAGLIAEGQKRIDAGLDDKRRVYYKLTAAGEEALDREIARYHRVVSLAKNRPSFGSALHGQPA